MGRVGAWWLSLLLIGACAGGYAQNPPHLLQRFHAMGEDPRAIRAVEQALALDASGAVASEALKPILALPDQGCRYPPKTADAPCERALEWWDSWPSVRLLALHRLTDAYFEAGSSQKPSETLTRAALDLLAGYRDAAYIAADGFAKLRDREAAERSLARAPLSPSQRDMRIGIWFNDLDLATSGAIGAVKDVGETSRDEVWDEIEPMVIAAGRIDLEKKLALARMNYSVGTENEALRAIARLLELGEHDVVRKELEWHERFSSGASFAWVSFVGFLRLGERERAEKIAAPWIAREKNPPCSQKIHPFVGHEPYCNLAFHFREALEAGDHPTATGN
jgi:hypothetical protein